MMISRIVEQQEKQKDYPTRCFFMFHSIRSPFFPLKQAFDYVVMLQNVCECWVESPFISSVFFAAPSITPAKELSTSLEKIKLRSKIAEKRKNVERLLFFCLHALGAFINYVDT